MDEARRSKTEKAAKIIKEKQEKEELKIRIFITKAIAIFTIGIPLIMTPIIIGPNDNFIKILFGTIILAGLSLVFIYLAGLLVAGALMIVFPKTTTRTIKYIKKLIISPQKTIRPDEILI